MSLCIFIIDDALRDLDRHCVAVVGETVRRKGGERWLDVAGREHQGLSMEPKLLKYGVVSTVEITSAEQASCA